MSLILYKDNSAVVGNNKKICEKKNQIFKVDVSK